MTNRVNCIYNYSLGVDVTISVSVSFFKKKGYKKGYRVDRQGTLETLVIQGFVTPMILSVYFLNFVDLKMDTPETLEI